MWSKRQIIQRAFEHIGLGSAQFDLSVEDYQTALKRLDSIMSTWEAGGVDVGYNYPTDSDSNDIDLDSGLSGYAIEPVAMTLGERLASGYGKQLTNDYHTDTKTAVRQMYIYLLQAQLAEAQNDLLQYDSNLPVGQGNKPWRTGNGNWNY